MVSAWQEPPDAMSAEKPAGTDGISAEKPAGVRDGLEVLAFSTTEPPRNNLPEKCDTRDNRTIKWGDPPGRPSSEALPAPGREIFRKPSGLPPHLYVTYT